ncbi:hypothetical protein [Niveibacterium sp.]|uniref:hypothetical protein n=1 Tax=Niveibacterium sp. TaxID=2017444 RepID=UPI0035B06BD6
MAEVVDVPALSFALKRSLAQVGVDIPHGHCQQLLAASLGYGTLAAFQAAQQPLEFWDMERAAMRQDDAPIPVYVTDVLAESHIRSLHRLPDPYGVLTDIVWNPALCEARLRQLGYAAMSSQMMAALTECLPKVFNMAFAAARIHAGSYGFVSWVRERIRTEAEDACVRRELLLHDSGGIDLTRSVIGRLYALEQFVASPVRPVESDLLPFFNDVETVRTRLNRDGGCVSIEKAGAEGSVRHIEMAWLARGASSVIDFVGTWELGAGVPYGALLTYRGRFLVERVMCSFFSLSLSTVTSAHRSPVLNPNRNAEGEMALRAARARWGADFEREMYRQCVDGDRWIPKMYFDPMSHLGGNDEDEGDTYGGAPYE